MVYKERWRKEHPVPADLEHHHYLYQKFDVNQSETDIHRYLVQQNNQREQECYMIYKFRKINLRWK